MSRIKLWFSRGGWIIFGCWLLIQVAVTAQRAALGQRAIDFLSYRVAADALRHQSIFYRSIAATQLIWRSFHEAEQALLRADPSQRRDVMKQNGATQQPGPYIYPPTLALLIAQFDVRETVFCGLTIAAVAFFAGLWLRATGQSSFWLLLVIGSLDVFGTILSGNVELILLGAALGAAWLIWRGRGLLAAPFIAGTVLVKPFYLGFFAAFALILWFSANRRASAKAIAWAGAGSLALIGIETLRWEGWLRAEAFAYFRQAFDYQWFRLPIDQQTPMSIWNRTPLQVLVNSGVPVGPAQAIVLALCILWLIATLLVVRRRAISFPLAFALALVLLYLGRPVGWTLMYLDFVVLTVAWPSLSAWPRRALLIGTIGLMVSRLMAFSLTLDGQDMQLLTMQTANLPWETLLVLPCSGLIVLACAARSTIRAPDRGNAIGMLRDVS